MFKIITYKIFIYEASFSLQKLCSFNEKHPEKGNHLYHVT